MQRGRGRDRGRDRGRACSNCNCSCRYTYVVRDHVAVHIREQGKEHRIWKNINKKQKKKTSSRLADWLGVAVC